MNAKLLFLNSMHKALEDVIEEVEITEVAFLISIINRFIDPIQPVHHSVTLNDLHTRFVKRQDTLFLIVSIEWTLHIKAINHQQNSVTMASSIPYSTISYSLI